MLIQTTLRLHYNLWTLTRNNKVHEIGDSSLKTNTPNPIQSEVTISSQTHSLWLQYTRNPRLNCSRKTRGETFLPKNPISRQPCVPLQSWHVYTQWISRFLTRVHLTRTLGNRYDRVQDFKKHMIELKKRRYDSIIDEKFNVKSVMILDSFTPETPKSLPLHP